MENKEKEIKCIYTECIICKEYETCTDELKDTRNYFLASIEYKLKKLNDKIGCFFEKICDFIFYDYPYLCKFLFLILILSLPFLGLFLGSFF